MFHVAIRMFSAYAHHPMLAYAILSLGIVEKKVSFQPVVTVMKTVSVSV